MFWKKLESILRFNWSFVLFLLVIIWSLLGINKGNSKYNLNDNEFVLICSNVVYQEDKIVIYWKGKEKLISYSDSLENIVVGNTYLVSGNLYEPSNNTIPNLFNYKKYLNDNNIYYLLNIKDLLCIKNSRNIVYKLKNYILSKVYESENRDYIYTFLFNDSSYLNSNAKNLYQDLGIVFLFSIGSLFSYYMIFLLTKLFKKININNILSMLLIIFFLIFYYLLTDSLGTLRILILYILKSFNYLFKWYFKRIDMFYLTFAILLIFNYKILFLSSFQYLFVILYSIIKFNNIKTTKLRGLLYISFISFMFSLPLNLYYNYAINFFSVLWVLLFYYVIRYFLFILCNLTFILPFMNKVLSITITVIEKLAYLCNRLDFLNITFKKPSIFLIIIYYLIIFYFFQKRNIKRFILFILLLLFHFHINIIIPSNKLIVVDVGEGDTILFMGSNETFFIDCGSGVNGNYSNKIIDYIKSEGIRVINAIVITHGDFDHMGEAINLVENFKVENVIFNCGEYNDLEKELIKVLDKKKIKYYSCIKELNIDKYKLQFLNTTEYVNENDNSNVVYFNYNNYQFLFMGDAGIEKEKDILDKYNLKDIDFLKVGHHGSNTSSSEYFIDKINPEYSLISVGKNNRYGHPKDEVLDTLKNSKIYRTDLDGSIEIILNKNGYKIRTCPP